MSQRKQAERLLSAIFGENFLAFSDRPRFIWENPDGHTVIWAIRQALHTLSEREARVIMMHFGLRTGEGLRFDQVGVAFGVSRERIRQIEMKGLRKLRHPTRAHFLRPFMYLDNHADKRAALARGELCLLLQQIYPDTFSYEFVMRLRRRYLAAAFRALRSAEFKHLGRLAAWSCQFQTEIGACLLCGEPSLPQSDWCLVHLELKSQIVAVCDGCGIKFSRRPSQLTSFTKTHGRTQYALFHNKACFYANSTRTGIWRYRASAKQSSRVM